MQLNDMGQTKDPYLGSRKMGRQRDLAGTYYEFFAGGGMARAGLGDAWTCLFSNDIDEKKAGAYKRNWGPHEILVKDVGEVRTCELPSTPDLVWASFPCQDLSLAGMGAGLKGHRSGTFWSFWRLIQKLKGEGRGPRLIVLENVCGTLTSHGGADFRSLIQALRFGGYKCGAVVIDAALFLPQSRPRLFIIGVRNDIKVRKSVSCEHPDSPFHTPALLTAYRALPEEDRAAWLWWNLPAPARRQLTFADVIESNLPWHKPEVTAALLSMMSPRNRAKVERARLLSGKSVGTVYKRTRPDETGKKLQRAEVRFDNVAGCLRTPGGGSSRQLILVVEEGMVRSRLLSPREAARLMGLPDQYILPEKYNDAYHLMGDGIAVPVVRHLAEYLLEPLLSAEKKLNQEAA